MGRRSGAARRKSKAGAPAPASLSANEASTAKVDIDDEYDSSELESQWDILSKDFSNFLGQLERLQTDPRMSEARRKKFEISSQHVVSACIQALLAVADPSRR